MIHITLAVDQASPEVALAFAVQCALPWLPKVRVPDRMGLSDGEIAKSECRSSAHGRGCRERWQVWPSPRILTSLNADLTLRRAGHSRSIACFAVGVVRLTA